jgi:hypothetical protein
MGMIPKFRKKPVVVEAFRWYPGSNVPWIKECGIQLPESERVGKFYNRLHGSELEVVPGDWIICQGAEDRYPCKPDVFERTYEPVE